MSPRGGAHDHPEPEAKAGCVRAIRLRLLGAVIALAAGTGAVVAAILLVRSALA